MKKPIHILSAAILWFPLTFLTAKVMDAPLVARPSEPVKPLKVWTGEASWYGAEFEGRKTANGEQFDPELLTAAHLKLPFGSIVRVVNPRNNKFEVVRINDRGPYHEGREIDVSYRVAQRIGLVQSGVGRVRLELLQLPEKKH